MTAQKKLFFGVTQKQIDEQKRANAEELARQSKQKEVDDLRQKRDAESAERQYLMEKFDINLNNPGPNMAAIKSGTFGGVMGMAFYVCLSFYVNGFIDTFQGKENVGSSEWSQSVVNPIVDGKFDPSGAWYRQLAFLVVSVCVTIGVYKAFKEDESSFFPDTSAERAKYRESKQKVRALDMMLDLEKLGAEYNLNSHQVKRLVKKVPEIIQGMAAEKRVYFDMLMDGKIDIKDNKTFHDMAVQIMWGHLKSHPADAQLILDTFDEASLPDVLLRECKNKLQYMGR